MIMMMLAPSAFTSPSSYSTPPPPPAKTSLGPGRDRNGRRAGGGGHGGGGGRVFVNVGYFDGSWETKESSTDFQGSLVTGSEDPRARNSHFLNRICTAKKYTTYNTVANSPPAAGPREPMVGISSKPHPQLLAIDQRRSPSWRNLHKRNYRLSQQRNSAPRNAHDVFTNT